MNGIMDGRFRIEAADTAEKYEGLRALWNEVFGDPLLYIDSFYENFAGDIRGYVVTDENGRVCSALSCYLCGSYMEKPVYVSYAVCTREDMRGQGLGAMLTAHVRDLVTKAGGISLVSPAERSLEEFYAANGYERAFYAAERAVLSPEFDMEEYDDYDEYDLDFGDEDSAPAATQIAVQKISGVVYNKYREAFLSAIPHVELSDPMIRLIESEYGLWSVNGGDAVCAVSGADPMRLVISELITSPVLLELSLDIDTEIAAMAAQHFGSAEAVYRTPGAGACQSMAAGHPVPEEDEEGIIAGLPYFGFPVD